MEPLESLFRPRSVAVVGASRNPKKLGHVILKNILEGGFEGDIIPVNPKADEILGLKAYDIDSMPRTDTAVISIPAKYVPEAIEKLGKKGVKSAIVISSGFAEVGNVDLQRSLVKAARKHGMRVLGPNCAGLINAFHKYYPTFEVRVKPGKAAFVTQSGALGGAVLMELYSLDKGLGVFVSYGNAADVNEADLIEYLKEREELDAIAFYIEGLHEGRRFVEALKGAKNVYVLKGGKTEAGSKAASSHTASLSGDRAMFRSIVGAYARILNDTRELFLAIDAMNYGLKRVRRVAILTNSGGPGVLAADELDKLGLELPDLSSYDRSFLPPFASRRNPIDMAAGADYDVIYKSMKVLNEAPEVDGILFIFVPPIHIPAENAVKAIIDAEPKKPVVAVLMGGSFVKNARVMLEKHGIPVVSHPEDGAKLISLGLSP